MTEVRQHLEQTQQELEEVRDAVIQLADSIDHLATKEEVGIAYAVAEKKRKKWLTIILIAGVVICSALTSLWFTSQSAKEEDQDRARASCAVVNGNKQLIKEILALSSGDGTQLPDLTEAQAAALAAQAKQFNERVTPLLQPVDCEEFVHEPGKYLNDASGFSLE